MARVRRRSRASSSLSSAPASSLLTDPPSHRQHALASALAWSNAGASAASEFTSRHLQPKPRGALAHPTSNRLRSTSRSLRSPTDASMRSAALVACSALRRRRPRHSSGPLTPHRVNWWPSRSDATWSGRSPAPSLCEAKPASAPEARQQAAWGDWRAERLQPFQQVGPIHCVHVSDIRTQ